MTLQILSDEREATFELDSLNMPGDKWTMEVEDPSLLFSNHPTHKDTILTRGPHRFSLRNNSSEITAMSADTEIQRLAQLHKDTRGQRSR
ncbi:hypothetical protein OSTOST_24722, partial [Ostertagia ostertagi]